jgi:uncharacterized membrane protein YcaP (DUF421 family)
MDTILRAALMYLFVLIVLRVTTRRLMRSATPLDMAIVFLIGGLGIQPVLGEDRSITGAMLAVATISSLHIALSRLRHWAPTIGKVAEGTPVMIYANGAWDLTEMGRLRVQQRDVVAEMRQQGIREVADVHCVIVEHNGGITILPKPPQKPG